MKNLFKFLYTFICMTMLIHPSLYAQVNPLSAAQSSGTQNYILNGGFENSRHGWITYKTAAQALPTTGSGGSPTTTLTTSTSAPISGKASGLITHPASNVQGEGVSYAFALDKDARGQTLQITGTYEIASGTYSGGTGAPSITDSDLEVYVYDVDSGNLIQPAGYRLDGGVAGVTYQIQATFQPVSLTSVNYRLIFHEATTTTSAFVVRLDSLKVVRAVRTYATAVTDWQPFTAGGSWSTSTANYTGYYRRVGDSAEVFVTISLTSSPTVASLTLNLPNSLKMDTTKLNTSLANVKVGDMNISPNGIQAGMFATASSNSTLAAFLINVSSTNTVNLPAVDATHPQAFASGNNLVASFKVPIVGWGSSTQTSDSTDSRVVAASGYSSSGDFTPINTGATTGYPLNTTTLDTHGGFNAGSGTYVIQVPGIYDTDWSMSYVVTATAGYMAPTIAQNGATIAQAISAPDSNNGNVRTITAKKTFTAKAGDIISYQYVASGLTGPTVRAASYLSFFNIKRQSGASQVATTDTVAARYNITSGQSVPTSLVAVIGNVKVFDTLGAYNTTTGGFTCPVPGKYHVTALVTTASVTIPTNGAVDLQLFKNGAFYSDINSVFSASNGAPLTYRVPGSDTVQCVAGDTLTVMVTSTTATALNTLSGYNYVNFLRVGN